MTVDKVIAKIIWLTFWPTLYILVYNVISKFTAASHGPLLYS